MDNWEELKELMQGLPRASDMYNQVVGDAVVAVEHGIVQLEVALAFKDEHWASMEDKIEQLEADLERHEAQIRHYPDTYLGKIFFQGIECGRGQLEAELASREDWSPVELDIAENQTVRALEAKNERLKKGHDDIVAWGNAYPVSIFPEPDLEQAHELLKAGGMTLDAVSASAMRRVLKGVIKIASDALQEGG